MPSIKYNVGDVINGVLFIKEGSFNRRRRGVFQCPLCPNTFETRLDSVVNGHAKTCGCGEGAGGKPKHGHTSHSTSPSRTYISWVSMQNRCYGTDPTKKEAYRDKGVIVCERWIGKHGFENFLIDMGERPIGKTLDRFPNKHGNYFLENCRWATPKQQANNLTTNLMVIYKGEEKTLSEWCDILKVDYFRMRERIFRAGISPDISFTEPKRSALICRLTKELRENKKQPILVSNTLIPHSFGHINSTRVNRAV